jgi:hypothetical protein
MVYWPPFVPVSVQHRRDDSVSSLRRGSSDRLSRHVAHTEALKLALAYGEGILPVQINPSVKPEDLFTTFYGAAVFALNLTRSIVAGTC